MCGDDEKETDVPAIAATITTHMRAAPASAGDLESLFREHHERVFRAAYRITGSATDAEDVLQTIFLRLASAPQARDLSPNPAAYLHRAAVNASLDLVRARSRSVSFDSETHEFASGAAGPDAVQADRELQTLVRQAVARLGEKSAAVFALRYFEGYDNREIADLLGTSQMVVAVTLHRARTRLRKEIGEYLEKHHEA